MIPMQSDKARFLRVSLLLNAIFSIICGLLMIFFNDPIVALMGIPTINIQSVGVMLLLFASLIILVARLRETWPQLVLAIILSDWAWVIGSAVLLLLAHSQFSGTGVAIIIAVAIIVADFAVLQWIGLKRATRSQVFTP